MEWTFWGDPHAKPDNLDKIETLFDIAEELGNPVMILGDLLDTKEVIRGKCVNLILERMSKSKLRFVTLVGNHDWFNLECKDHSLRALQLLPNVTVVDKPQMLTFSEGVQGLCVPYVHHEAEFAEILKRFPQADLLVIHQGVEGYDYGNGRIAEKEDGVISQKLIKRFKRVISGHFHAYQALGNLIFLGTPFSHSYGESNQKKFIGLFNPENYEMELVPTPFPQHSTVELDCDAKTNQALNKFRKYAKESTDYIRVILKGTQENINKFDQSEFSGVKFIERPVESNEDNVKVSETDSNAVKFKMWAEEIKHLDPETVALGLEILGSVKK